MSRSDRTRKTPLIVFGDEEQDDNLNSLLGIRSDASLAEKETPIPESYSERGSYGYDAPIADAPREHVPEPEEKAEVKPAQFAVEDMITTSHVEQSYEKEAAAPVKKAVMPDTVYHEPVKEVKEPAKPVQMSLFDEWDEKQVEKPLGATKASVETRPSYSETDGYVGGEPLKQEKPRPVERKVEIHKAPSEMFSNPSVERPVVKPQNHQDVPRQIRSSSAAYSESTSYSSGPDFDRGAGYRDDVPQTSYGNSDSHAASGEAGYPYENQPENGVAGMTFAQQLRGYEYAKIPQKESQHHSYQNRIITVYSPKGGVGKSTIAKELALALSSEGPDKESYRVLLIDSDWEFGDVATLFNVRNVPNMTGLVKSMRKERHDTKKISIRSPQELTQYLIPYRAGGINKLDLLVSSGNATDQQLIDEHVVRALIDNFRTLNYDFIIFDNANSIEPRTLLPLMVADFMVLVETLDSTTIFETRALIQTLRSRQFDFGKIRMVFNRVPQDSKNLDITTDDVENLLKVRTVASIPNVGDAARLMNNACESFILGKDSPVSREIKKLANSITVCYKEPKKGFFARLFSKK